MIFGDFYLAWILKTKFATRTKKALQFDAIWEHFYIWNKKVVCWNVKIHLHKDTNTHLCSGSFKKPKFSFRKNEEHHIKQKIFWIFKEPRQSRTQKLKNNSWFDDDSLLNTKSTGKKRTENWKLKINFCWFNKDLI